MKSDFQSYTVEQLIQMDMLEPPMDGNHGSIHPKTSDYVSDGVPFIMANDLVGGTIDFSSCAHITEKQASTLRKGFSHPGDILLTHKATIGRTAVVPDNYPTIILTPQITYYRVKRGIYNRYLKYYFDSAPFQRLFNNWAGSGSTRAYLGITAQRKLPIVLPPYDLQVKISSILRALDDKIELNNRINENLYKQLEQSFVHDYLEECPKHSEWELTILDRITDKFATGLNPRKNFVLGHGSNFYVTIKNMSNNRIYLDNKCDRVDDAALVKINARSDLRSGDLLFSGIGTIGRTYLIDRPANNWNISESVFTIRPSSVVSSEFLYLLLLSKEMQDYAVSNSSGSVQKGIRMADLKKYPVICPAKDYMEKLTSMWRPIIKMIKLNEDEVDKLSEIRNALLPKIMSGEVDVSEIDL